MKVFLRSQKPSWAHVSQTRFLSTQPLQGSEETPEVYQPLSLQRLLTTESKICHSAFSMEAHPDCLPLPPVFFLPGPGTTRHGRALSPEAAEDGGDQHPSSKALSGS